ncbi:MAG: mannose-1-phosphate guanylyltransferase/mannose-6-phosphate isomerase [bacterium]|nr:mannose-1-phosphate guanylyltransferase/mannose-6-phosphate isomerase [bacterium]
MIAMILAGGTGTRLWPFSRSTTPKQFLNLGSSHESLLQETCKRLEGLISPDRLWIVGATAHQYELQQQIEEAVPAFDVKHLLFEPMGRNTAPAILWGISRIPEEQRDEPVVILPADHLIQDAEGFREKLAAAQGLAEEGWIVTFGITPNRPDTGYGYIQAGQPVGPGFKVSKFAEKPNLDTAQAYLAEGNYSWNAGIFMATARTLMTQYQVHCPELYAAFFEEESCRTEVVTQIDQVYGAIKEDSFDYAVLEHSDRVAVVQMSVGWNDLGSWESIYEVNPKDAQGNATRGNVVLEDTQNCLIISDKRLVTGVGLKDLIIVETEDALLVCDLNRSQDVKTLVNHLKAEDRGEYKFHQRVVRPWGSYTVLREGAGFKVKKIEVLPGKRLSLQRHLHRSEHWVVLKGTALVTRGSETLLMTENQSTYLPKTERHRLENPGKEPLEIIEVQLGSYLGEDDIQRFDDDFGRNA